MNYTLRNKNLEVKIDHPLHNYQSSRFDWTGKITEVKFLGKPTTITEKPDGENENIYGKGLYNEFSMDTALGFADAEIGDWFHKIGIGLLKKDSPEYEFFREYEIQPAEFTVLIEVDRLIIECTSDDVNGFAYILRKEIVLNEDRLILNYTLENNGLKEIEVEEYVHNFMSINHALVNSDYELKFPFQIVRDASGNTVNPDDILQFDSTNTRFLNSTDNQFFASYLNGNDTVESQWELINQSQNIGVRESTSFQTKKVNLWGWKHVISPELFHHFKIKTGETEKWSRTYSFFEIN